MASVYVALPWEDLLGIGGWVLYVFVAALLLSAIVPLGYRALGFWFLVVRLHGLAWRHGTKSLMRFRDYVVGIGMVLVLALLGLVFEHLVVHQLVQEVRFYDDGVELAYRWPWLNTHIPYRSITAVRIADDPPRLAMPGARPRRGFPVKVVIETREREYKIGDGPPQWRTNKAKAIYEELVRRSISREGAD